MTHEDASSPGDEGGIEIPDDVEITVWDPNGGHRTCAECGRDCVPEAMATDDGMRIAFVCAEHGVHSVVDPFEGER